MVATVAFALATGLSTQTAEPRWTLQDAFGRDVGERGVISGVPEESGDYRARIAVTDNDPTSHPIYITVAMVVEDSF